MENFYRFGVRNVDGDQSHLFEMMTAEWVRVISTFTSGDPARDIAIGPDGRIWLLKKAPGTSHLDDEGVDFELFVYNGFGLYRQRSGWDRVPGEGVAITVDQEGHPWLAQASGAIVRHTDDGWERLPGAATDLSVGANGAAWAIGTGEVPGGHEILRWTGQNWEVVSGGAVRIAVSPTGDPWVINDRDQIFRRMGGRWYRVRGGAIDIAFGADGNCWINGNDGGGQGGNGVYHWNGRDWDRTDGAGMRIAVQNNGMPWMINIRGNVYSRHLNH